MELEYAQLFRVVFADIVFQPGGERALKFPIVIGEMAGVEPAIASYLMHRFIYEGSQVSSLTKEAYILSEWASWLDRKGLRPTEGSIDELRQFRTNQNFTAENVISIKEKTPGQAFPIRRETQNVSTEYQEAGRRLNITIATKLDYIYRFQVFHKVPRRRRIKISKGERNKGRKARPTPTTEQAEAVVNGLLDEKNTDRASTYNLAARLMNSVGLRSGGTAGFSVSALSKALAEEGIFCGSDKPVPYDLSSLGGNDTEKLAIRRDITAKLKALLAKKRRSIFINVTEKGTKTRSAPLPILLATEILDYIWSERFIFVQQRKIRHRSYRAPDAVFLSWKTGIALTSDAIGNKINAKFRSLGIPGSGHRLRARFAHDLVRDLYLRARALHGRAWDAHTVLEHAAVILGHEGIETLRFYLNNIIQEENGLGGEPLVAQNSDDAAIIRGILSCLDGPDLNRSTRVRQALYSLAGELGIDAVAEPGAL